ncbi:hypothetical protein [Novosphingobium sp.]|uniref:hypothetical protein n=1 Tax=Novosphingobium sp. TaxID=1874826 RepID=UPI001DE6BC22|nr:hypothetical protein [Novosphingobium sp.]MBX9665110.1 hypothetical protein [Novosphingobium sp.]
MAGASADGEVNHWPAFVDVLTTVIMVVTFLLVIMSAAVMQLSQRVIANLKQQMIQQEQQQKKPGKDGKPIACAPGAAPVLSPREAEAGTSVSELGAVLRSPTASDGAERLSIRTRDTPETLKLQIKAQEQPDDVRGVEVKTADTLLKIAFAPNAATYDEANSARVIGFLKGKARPGTKYEIWSFAPQTRSVSEAQRIAFYRAAMTRNLLLRAGLAPADVTTQIRVADAASPEGHMVRVVIKP